jgi:hypothetical protein
MNKLFIFGGILFLGMTSLDAREIGFRPRFNVGVMSYDFSNPATVFSPAEPLNNTSPTVTDEWSVQSDLPLIRTGFTLFFDHTFLDFDFQYAFDGHDKTRLSSWAPLAAGTLPGLDTDSQLYFDTHAELDFERTEFALTLGYAVSEQLAIYTGYKRADSNTDFNFAGRISAVPANDPSTSPSVSDFSAQLNQELVYKGPFLGATYTWNTNKLGLEGALTGNIGLAFLEAESDNLGFKNFELSDGNGASLPVSVAAINSPPFNLAKLNGDTVGLSLAFTWNGFTPIEGLMYSVGLNNYQYNFDGKNGQDFTIDIFRFDAGVTYFFDL